MGSEIRRARDGLESAATRTLMTLPDWAQRRLAGGGAVRLDGQELLPEVRLLLSLIARSGIRPMETLSPGEARADLARAARRLKSRPIPMARVADRRIPGPAGDIRVRVYRPPGMRAPAPLVVYYHGGGWVVCDLDTHDPVCRSIARETGALVVSVDYRLAPEHRFPAAVEDALAAFRWAAGRGRELGIDPQRIAVAGDSAGGNLAAVVSQLCVREDLAGLPPAHIVTAGFDPLRDEGEAYARRLESAGVPVILRRHAGLVHGFVNHAAISPRSRQAFHQALRTTAQHLRGNVAPRH